MLPTQVLPPDAGKEHIEVTKELATVSSLTEQYQESLTLLAFKLSSPGTQYAAS
jgi:hypothetical protein